MTSQIMTRLLLAGMMSGAAMVFAGCPDDQVSFHDDIDRIFDFQPFHPARRPPDGLHSPYVLGTEFRMYAWRDHDKMELDGAWGESLDPGVLVVSDRTSSDSVASFHCVAMGEGTADVFLYRSSDQERTWGRATVEVARPASVDMVFAGPFFVDASRDEFRVDGAVKILVGGTATFLVEYFDEAGRKLAGNNVLEPMPRGDQVIAWAAQTYMSENREWIQVSPKSPGTHEVDLTVAGHTVGRLVIEAVRAGELAFIELLSKDDHRAKEDETLAVLAVGYADTGEPIYGIEFDWAMNGFRQSEAGDLYMYRFQPDTRSNLEATFGHVSQNVRIHADEDGWVASTNDLYMGFGCAAGGTAGASGIFLVALAALGILVMTRRPSLLAARTARHDGVLHPGGHYEDTQVKFHRRRSKLMSTFIARGLIISLPIILSLTLTACGGDSKVDGLCQRSCSWYQKCEPADFQEDHANLEDCIKECHERWDAMRQGWDSACYDAILDAYDCSIPAFEYPYDCGEVFEDGEEEGENDGPCAAEIERMNTVCNWEDEEEDW